MATYKNFFIVSMIVVIAYYPTMTDLMERWIKFDESQSHGLIILALFAYLLTEQLKQLPSEVRTPNWLVIIVLTACSITWCLAAALNIESIEQLLLLPIVFFLCWSLLGFRSIIALAPSISLLIFVIPIWDYLTPALVDISSKVVSHFIEWSNITAMIDGNSIYLPYGRIDIADGCSGLRYLTIAMALAYYLILTSTTSIAAKAKLLGTAILLGLFTNWLRIYIIIMVAHYTEMQSSLIKDHELFGWLLFIIACLPLVYFSRTLPVLAKITAATVPTSPFPKRVILISTFALVIGPLLYAAMKTDVSAPNIGNWQQLGYHQAPISSDAPFLLPQSYYNLIKENNAITQEIAIHWQKSQQSDLVPYIANSLNRDYWTLVQSNNLQTAEKRSIQLNLYSRKAQNQFSCTASWYQVGTLDTTSYYVAKLLQIPALLSQQKLFTAAVVTISSATADCAPYQQQLIDIASETHADIVQLIDTAPSTPAD